MKCYEFSILETPKNFHFLAKFVNYLLLASKLQNIFNVGIFSKVSLSCPFPPLSIYWVSLKRMREIKQGPRNKDNSFHKYRGVLYLLWCLWVAKKIFNFGVSFIKCQNHISQICQKKWLNFSLESIWKTLCNSLE